MCDNNDHDNDYWDDDYFEKHRDDYSTGGSGSGDCGNGPGAMFLIGIVILLLGGLSEISITFAFFIMFYAWAWARKN